MQSISLRRLFLDERPTISDLQVNRVNVSYEGGRSEISRMPSPHLPIIYLSVAIISLFAAATSTGASDGRK